MDLEELRAFVLVAEHGSFSAAAELLREARTTLRRRVESLEARAGPRLLVRTRSGVELTDAGRALAARGREVMEEVSSLLVSLRESQQEPAGLLRCVLPLGMPPHVLAAVVGLSHARYPKLRAELRFSEDPLGEPLLETELALHFGEVGRRGPWLSHEVMRVKQRLYASPHYLARRGVPSAPAELHDHVLLAWRAPGESGSEWPLADGGVLRVEPSLVSTDVHFLRQCILQGMGIGFIPNAGVPEADPTLPELVEVLPEQVGAERCLSVSVPRVLANLPRVRVILQHAMEYVERQRGADDATTPGAAGG